MQQTLPMDIPNGVRSTTTKVWETLVASRDGNLDKLKALLEECLELAYAQYNYTPPIHFAVREGHVELVQSLLKLGALDPTYKTYPFGDTLLTIAEDRGHTQIAGYLQKYLADPSLVKFKGDNGEIYYNKPEAQVEFEKIVDKNELSKAEEIVKEYPEFLHDPTSFWGEGILMMPAKDGDMKLVELLMQHGAKVPDVSKWGRFYYFKHYEIAAFLMENGMNPNHKTWHHVTLLHDMAQEGDIEKAKLLLKHGADINSIEEEYQSTPLGLAARWGNTEMVKFLLAQGADPEKSGASWATPLAWAKKKGHAEIEALLVKSE
ncbi:MAG: ankyrin repeat domain-containing protein [Chitinophagaceae bacterium]